VSADQIIPQMLMTQVADQNKTIEELQAENARLHQKVEALQGEGMLQQYQAGLALRDSQIKQLQTELQSPEKALKVVSEALEKNVEEIERLTLKAAQLGRAAHLNDRH